MPDWIGTIDKLNGDLCMITTIDHLPTIAGKHGGKKVQATQEAANIFTALESIANKGNHWAVLAVKEIKALTSGRINSNHTYVSVSHHNGEDEFFLVLPGCTIQAFRRSDDSYFINSIDSSLDFHEQQKEYSNPGLFFVEADKRQNSWKIKPRKKDNIKGKGKEIPVGISDRYKTIQNAASVVNAHIQASPYQDKRIDGYNLFYTPGKKTIGGLFNLKESFAPDKAKSLSESAQLLAESMIAAKKKEKSVVWISQKGGSGILTQAMSIVKKKGVKLGKDQKVFLSHPTTRHIKAYELSQELEMGTDREFSSHNPINMNEFIGGLNVAGELNLIHERQKHEKGYGWKKSTWDTGKTALTGNGMAGTVKTLAAAAAFGSAFAPVGAIIAAFGVAKLAAGAVAAGGVVASNVGPAAHYPSLSSYAKTKLGVG